LDDIKLQSGNDLFKIRKTANKVSLDDLIKYIENKPNKDTIFNLLKNKILDNIKNIEDNKLDITDDNIYNRLTDFHKEILEKLGLHDEFISDINDLGEYKVILLNFNINTFDDQEGGSIDNKYYKKYLKYKNKYIQLKLQL
jgi:hypothetical protein